MTGFVKRNLRVLGSYLLVSLFVSNTLASEPELSLAAATKIARQQAVKDRLPDTHIVVEGIELPKPKHRVYLARFEPTVSDPTSKEPNRFVGISSKWMARSGERPLSERPRGSP